MYKFSVQTYQLTIIVEQPAKIQLGKLGRYIFQEGCYVYTGSAKRNMITRVTRHLSSPHKKLHWHIDYFLAHKFVRIVNVQFNAKAECRLNQECAGEIPVPGFGSSDCKQSCNSHLKFFPHHLTKNAAGLF
ncbi:MAG: DUF123 domain-containing protein [Acidiferrobacterales bacterium]